jgi:hypothetical protein
MITEEAAKAVRGFVVHGVTFEDMAGDQVIGDCPFSGTPKKFYVNFKNKLWDSKTAGLSGNFQKFLEIVAKENADAFRATPEAQKVLAISRQLPKSAFEKWGIGFDGGNFTIPVRNEKGKIVDLRTWRPKRKSMSTPGVQTGMFGHEQLHDPARKSEPVYICEGEWDAIALDWLLRLLQKPGIVVGLPGANTLKTEWVPSFNGRDVRAMYDADDAGAQGEARCYELLSAAAKSLRFVEWPPASPDGFDVRDWIVAGAVKGKKPRACLFALEAMIRGTKPRTKQGAGADKEEEGGEPKPELKPITRQELFMEYKKWLHMRDDEPLAVMFGTCFANRLQGDPLWLFFVAPPGGMKSELLMTLNLSPETYSVSTLTPHALVSGASWVGGEDPSLIPKLDGKVLIIKDFTTTLQMNPLARDEIFGQLRDAYDGKFEKVFGNGIVRRYESTFGIIAGVTPNIDAFSSLHSGLGERFLKYRLEGNTVHLDEKERILRAIGNINQENKMRDGLKDAAARFLSQKMPDPEPKVSPGMASRIADLAMLAARMRGVVNRDKYDYRLMTNKASFEIGTRLGKQISKLAIGVAVYYGEKVPSERTYKLVTRVTMSTVPDKVEEVVHGLWKLCPNPNSAAPTPAINKACSRLTPSTIFRTLQDLAVIGMVHQIGSGNKYQWQLDESIKNLIKGANAYGVARLN